MTFVDWCNDVENCVGLPGQLCQCEWRRGGGKESATGEDACRETGDENGRKEGRDLASFEQRSCGGISGIVPHGDGVQRERPPQRTPIQGVSQDAEQSPRPPYHPLDEQEPRVDEGREPVAHGPGTIYRIGSTFGRPPSSSAFGLSMAEHCLFFKEGERLKAHPKAWQWYRIIQKAHPDTTPSIPTLWDGCQKVWHLERKTSSMSRNNG